MTEDAEGGRRWPSLDETGVVVAGVVVFAVAWLPWFEARTPSGTVSFRAWDLGLVSWIGALLALYAAGRVLWLRRFPLKPEVPLSPGAEPFIASVIGMGLTLYRVLDVPSVALATVTRTPVLSVAAAAAVLQAVFALRVVARTGLRA